MLPDPACRYAVCVHVSGVFVIRETFPDGTSEQLVGSFATRRAAEAWIASQSQRSRGDDQSTTER